MRTHFGESLPQKLERLIRTAGITSLPLEDSFTAIKIHFGEPGNVAFLRSAYAESVVRVLNSCGARPFLTDCNTLYPGRRKMLSNTLILPTATVFLPMRPAVRLS